MVHLERLGVILKPEVEGEAKFNAGMAMSEGQVHVLYRFCRKREKWRGRPIDWTAVGDEFPYSANCICHALLDADGRLLADDPTPVISPERPQERLGCEDARIVPFEGAHLVFYCAFDGKKTRVGIARTKDFRRYEKLGIVDNFTFDKDAFIFPERIGGKIAYVHRIVPSVQIDYFDSLRDLLDPESWKDYGRHVDRSTVLRGAFPFDSFRVGGGVPPIKTAEGWIFIYHGVDTRRVYHIGAALLDLENPSRVRARIPYPIMSPEADYEMRGDYLGCIFPQGYFEKDGRLVISYGAADTNTALATVSKRSLVEELLRHEI